MCFSSYKCYHLFSLSILPHFSIITTITTNAITHHIITNFDEHQSSNTLAFTSSSLNGTQTQISSRTEEKVAPGRSSSRNASRDEALSLLDRIRPTIRSQTNGTITPNRSGSERGNWRSDGRRTPTTSSREVDRRRERGAGRDNSNATQVHTTTQPGTSRYR